MDGEVSKAVEVVRGQLVAERPTPRLTELKRRAESLGLYAGIVPVRDGQCEVPFLSVQVRNARNVIIGRITIDETPEGESERANLSCDCDAVAGLNQESVLVENARLVAAAFKALMGVPA
jgi:hypothetical protein